jgi:hypothetical protein
LSRKVDFRSLQVNISPCQSCNVNEPCAGVVTKENHAAPFRITYSQHITQLIKREGAAGAFFALYQFDALEKIFFKQAILPSLAPGDADYLQCLVRGGGAQATGKGIPKAGDLFNPSLPVRG